MGKIAREAKLNDEAIGAYKRAIELKPEQVTPREELVAVYMEQNSYKLAKKTIKDAFSISMKSPVLHINLAEILEAEGDIEAAVAEYKKGQGDSLWGEYATGKINQLKPPPTEEEIKMREFFEKGRKKKGKWKKKDERWNMKLEIGNLKVKVGRCCFYNFSYF